MKPRTTIPLRDGRSLRVEAGWQHTPYQSHHRISKRQARGLSDGDILRGHILHIDVGGSECPCCSIQVHTVLSGRWWPENN